MLSLKNRFLSIIAELLSIRGILVFLFIMNNQLINTKMLKCFVNQIVIQSPNMTQVTIAIEDSQ